MSYWRLLASGDRDLASHPDFAVSPEYWPVASPDSPAGCPAT
jgi:hypothetical protein